MPTITCPEPSKLDSKLEKQKRRSISVWSPEWSFEVEQWRRSMCHPGIWVCGEFFENIFSRTKPPTGPGGVKNPPPLLSVHPLEKFFAMSIKDQGEDASSPGILLSYRPVEGGKLPQSHFLSNHGVLGSDSLDSGGVWDGDNIKI